MFLDRFPVSIQHDSRQCGVACLKIICEYFGKKYSFYDISQYCHASKRGVSLLGISEGATSLGLDYLSFKCSVSALKDNLKYPAIIHWKQNHFVVLYKISKDGKYFHVSDPGRGLVKLSREEFEEGWWSTVDDDGNREGVAMLLCPDSAFGNVKSEMADSYSIKYVLSFFSQYRKNFAFILLALLAVTGLGVVIPYLTQAVVDKGVANKDMNIVWMILLGQFVITLSSTIFDFIRRKTVVKTSMNINVSLVSNFLDKLFKLPMLFFDTKQFGDLQQRIHDHTRIEEFLTSTMINIVFSIGILVTYGIMLYFYDIRIFIVMLSFSTIYLMWVRFFMEKRKVLDYSTFEANAENNNKTFQLLQNIQEIKLQGCYKRRSEEWIKSEKKLYQLMIKVLDLKQIQEVGGSTINQIRNILITGIASYAVISGKMTIGEMMAIHIIVGQLVSPIEQLNTFIYSLQDTKLGLERINEVHSVVDEDTDTEIAELENHEINMQNICFKYDFHSPTYTLDNISLSIPSGKVTAIVGASGSGKTTILKLLLGYYKILSGKILIGNKDINKLNKKQWREKCGIVMQESVIFSESIERNIAVEDKEIDKERLHLAAKVACIDEYINNLPLGYNTIIGSEGDGISQGQKQRILIARAIYKNPDFIFLDEATNSLDATNEQKIVNNLDEFYKGKTVVIVAHRLSTVKNADNIIVLEKGKIIEQGKHEQLVKLQGRYFELVKNQLELGM